MATKEQMEKIMKDLNLENQKLQNKIDELHKRIPLLKEEVQEMIDEAIKYHNWDQHLRNDYQ